ncbi:hypothetical protein ABH916_002840 [Peribacillus frigoritolerans]
MRDSCGSSGRGETPQAFTPRRLTARTKESEHLEGKSTTTHYLVNSNKVCENSLILKSKMKQAFQFELSHLFIIGQLREYLTKKAAPWWGIATFVNDYYEKVGAGNSSILIRSKLYGFSRRSLP